MNYLTICFGSSSSDKVKSRGKCGCTGCSKRDKSRFRKKWGTRPKSGSDSSDGNNVCRKKGKTPEQTEKRLDGLPAQPAGVIGVGMYGTNIPHIAFMPVSKDNPFYNMNHTKRGKALIINFEKWENTGIRALDRNPRRGSEKDKRDLEETLKYLDFDVETEENCTYTEFKDIIKRTRTYDHSQNDLFMLILMTHGEKNTVYMSDGIQVPVNLIWEDFEADMCPTLAGKPKIFIIQACRGSKYDTGTLLQHNLNRSTPELNRDVTDTVTFSYSIPNAADILVCFSCPLGHYSWRNPEKGSWFIQSFCKVFKEKAYEMDVQSIFTVVAREVALNYQSQTDAIESNAMKQVTSTSSTLIRTIKLHPKDVKVVHKTPPPIPGPSVKQRISQISAIAAAKKEESPAPEYVKHKAQFHRGSSVVNGVNVNGQNGTGTGTVTESVTIQNGHGQPGEEDEAEDSLSEDSKTHYMI